jgi:16S rRNA (cytidine1402-2'-O)-methyltransferase
MPGNGTLYVVAVPIGNPKDITLRALEVLKSVDAVICEEYREGSTLLKTLGVQNRLVTLNEHNEQNEAPQILTQLTQGVSFALISDAGTPVFADPGHTLIGLLTQAGIPVVPVPGPSSLMAALSLCDFKIQRFLFGGFLARDPRQRRKELEDLRSARIPVVLLDAPYRMVALLRDVAAIFGGDQPVMLACDITLPGEHIYRGSAREVLAQVGERESEFVLVIKT